MRRVCLACACAVAAFTTPAAVHAQTTVDTLLSRASVALNDLNYDRALLLSRQLLDLPSATRPQRLSALQLLAAAFYPEEKEKQHADSAMGALRTMVRMDATARLPRDITWGGLDSLLEVARATTYIASAAPDARYALVGPTGEATIAVMASRPSIFRLALKSAAGATLVADSIGPATSGTLRFKALNGQRPLLESGAYTLVVSALDPARGDSIVTRYGARVEVPALAFEAVPGPLEQSVLRPERFPPNRTRAFAAAGLLAAGTIGMAVAMRADEPVRSSFSLDVKAIGAAIGLAGGALWAGRSDRGGPLPLNVTYNETLKREHTARVAAANAANRQRLDAYRVQVSITGEER